jgi:hypothetical protein
MIKITPNDRRASKSLNILRPMLVRQGSHRHIAFTEINESNSTSPEQKRSTGQLQVEHLNITNWKKSDRRESRLDVKSGNTANLNLMSLRKPKKVKKLVNPLTRIAHKIDWFLAEIPEGPDAFADRVIKSYNLLKSRQDSLSLHCFETLSAHRLATFNRAELQQKLQILQEENKRELEVTGDSQELIEFLTSPEATEAPLTQSAFHEEISVVSPTHVNEVYQSVILIFFYIQKFFLKMYGLVRRVHLQIKKSQALEFEEHALCDFIKSIENNIHQSNQAKISEIEGTIQKQGKYRMRHMRTLSCEEIGVESTEEGRSPITFEFVFRKIKVALLLSEKLHVKQVA